MKPIIIPPDSRTKRYVIYIVRYVGYDGDVYTREYATHDKDDAIRVAKGYYKSGKHVAFCEETTTLRTLLTDPGFGFKPAHVQRPERGER